MSETPHPSELDAVDLDGVYDKFYVHEAGEIRNYLQRLAGERCGLMVRADGSVDSMGTMLLKVDATSFWIDVPASTSMLDAWTSAHLLRLEGSIDRAALRFACGPAQQETVDDKPALRLPIPERVLYMQRREFMRREPPAGSLNCQWRLPETGQVVRASIRDIGGGGLAIVATRSDVTFQTGDVLKACRIDLPDIGEVEVDLEVRHVLMRGHLGYDMAQAGCEFINLAPMVQRKLFRYLMQLDRDQVSRRRWDD